MSRWGVFDLNGTLIDRARVGPEGLGQASPSLAVSSLHRLWTAPVNLPVNDHLETRTAPHIAGRILSLEHHLARRPGWVGTKRPGPWSLTTKADHNRVRRGPILTDVLWLQAQISGNDRQAGRILQAGGRGFEPP